MCDRAYDWLKEAVLQKGPILLGALCPRMLHEGPWCGLAPTGYKLMRRLQPGKTGVFSRRQACQGKSQSPVVWMAG